MLETLKGEESSLSGSSQKSTKLTRWMLAETHEAGARKSSRGCYVPVRATSHAIHGVSFIAFGGDITRRNQRGGCSKKLTRQVLEEAHSQGRRSKKLTRQALEEAHEAATSL